MVTSRQTNASPQATARQQLSCEPDNSDIIAMAWCDKTSFNDIELMTGYVEKEVIALMQSALKPSSFRMWRKRVSGRQKKHAKLHRHTRQVNHRTNNHLNHVSLADLASKGLE